MEQIGKEVLQHEGFTAGLLFSRPMALVTTLAGTSSQVVPFALVSVFVSVVSIFDHLTTFRLFGAGSFPPFLLSVHLLFASSPVLFVGSSILDPETFPTTIADTRAMIVPMFNDHNRSASLFVATDANVITTGTGDFQFYGMISC